MQVAHVGGTDFATVNVRDLAARLTQLIAELGDVRAGLLEVDARRLRRRQQIAATRARVLELELEATRIRDVLAAAHGRAVAESDACGSLAGRPRRSA